MCLWFEDLKHAYYSPCDSVGIEGSPGGSVHFEDDSILLFSFRYCLHKRADPILRATSVLVENE
jgi:hypothetical protein